MSSSNMPSDRQTEPTAEPAAAAAMAAPGRRHAQRLREIYRSAGWPCRDQIEIELLANGLLERRQAGPSDPETLHVTRQGIEFLAHATQTNRTSRSAHERLVDEVARLMLRDGRLVWTGLSLRANAASEVAMALDAEHDAALPDRLFADESATVSGGRDPVASTAANWKHCRPDVFSIRPSSVASYVDPIVHEIKVSRADLLGDLKKPEKRAAYLGIGGQCWYVLGQDARGRAIASANEVPLECGVLLMEGGKLHVARSAPRKSMSDLPFHVWMALAKATPLPALPDGEALAQAPLA